MIFIITIYPAAKHHYESEEGKHTADPYRADSKSFHKHISEYRTYHKDKYRTVAEKNLFSVLGSAIVIVIYHCLSACAEIADAHGRSYLTAMYFAETLDLYAAGKRNQTVGDKVEFKRYESHRKQNKTFRNYGDLPPVDRCYIFEAMSDYFRKNNSRGKCKNGEQVAGNHRKLTLRHTYSQQNDVACLGISKYFTAQYVGVSVHEASRKCENCAQPP